MLGILLAMMLSQLETNLSMAEAVIYFDIVFDFTVGLIVPLFGLMRQARIRIHFQTVIEDVLC